MTKMTALVYGTLRPGNTETVEVEGFDMYDLGWFPGIVRGNGTITCERIEVRDDDHLAQLDRYEGYREGDELGSLYIREKVGDDFIYVFNRGELNEDNKISNGDWLEHRKEATGQNSHLSEGVA